MMNRPLQVPYCTTKAMTSVSLSTKTKDMLRKAGVESQVIDLQNLILRVETTNLKPSNKEIRS
jgi:hypothetical protein